MDKNSYQFSPALPDANFKVFHELMAKKVHDILLVSTPYDAWIIEEDGRLSERIVNEYRGLNLSRPPRLTWVATAEEALVALEHKRFDMVLTMPRLADTNAYDLGKRIKQQYPRLPVILLTHGFDPGLDEWEARASGIDLNFVWTGDTNLLVAIVKCVEDRMNADRDTELARVRIILFVEDLPEYASALLPVLYGELVRQTRSVLDAGLNEEHRMLTMRARPKILVATTYEEASDFFYRFNDCVLGVISDVQFPRGGRQDRQAGYDLLSMIHKERFDIPLLMTSADQRNEALARAVPAQFINKESATLVDEVHAFFKYSLGFDEFVFRMPDGAIVGQARDLRSLEALIDEVPDDSLRFHAQRNDFSRWLFTRIESILAIKIRDIVVDDFLDIDSMRKHLIQVIDARRTERQMGVVADFKATEFDPVNTFYKIGRGSLGGKARGLAFVASLLRQNETMRKKFEDVNLSVPRTLVIASDIFEHFVEENHLKLLAKADVPDQEISERFLAKELPTALIDDLRTFLDNVNYPLAVRSSSLLEDAQFRAYAGLYRTYMLPNDHSDLEVRLKQLQRAILLVYASTYYLGPKSFSKRVGRRIENEHMAVIVQELVGQRYSGYFYPAISGVAQSHNYYPFARMKPEDGISTVALGFGRVVVEGERTLRFSPRHPQILPQRSSVDDILENSQRYFYSLCMDKEQQDLNAGDSSNLIRREVVDAADDPPMALLASTYVADEQRIRDGIAVEGHRLLTFAPVLKYKAFPLADILDDVLQMGQLGMGSPVELEFSVNMGEAGCAPDFAFLQLRPMTARAELGDVHISEAEQKKAVCFSTHALGNVHQKDMFDVVYVKPDAFDKRNTREIAGEVSQLNRLLLGAGRKYLLVGPGRWGTADHWLGIPVQWSDISGVGAIMETADDLINAEPSQGSHFFHNIITLGINYITLKRNDEDFLNWQWLRSQPLANETDHVAHTVLNRPFVLKVDGQTSTCVILAGE